MSLLLLEKLKKEKLTKPVFILLIILLAVHVIMLVISQFLPTLVHRELDSLRGVLMLCGKAPA